MVMQEEQKPSEEVPNSTKAKESAPKKKKEKEEKVEAPPPPEVSHLFSLLYLERDCLAHSEDFAFSSSLIFVFHRYFHGRKSCQNLLLTPNPTSRMPSKRG